jgi:hypothetical protein
MADYRASDVDRIEMRVGETRSLDSLRQAVVPPYVMIVPFLELPTGLELVRQDNLDEEGVHGAVFTLHATRAGNGTLRVGFRDIREGKVVIEKTVAVTVHE